MENKEHTLSILVENTPGVLSQVSRLFSRKGYNIDSIASGATEFTGHVIRDGKVAGTMALYVAPMTDNERQIVLDGCLINFNRNKR